MLGSFGIPANEIPLSATGTILKVNHMAWIAKRKIKELSLGSGKTIAPYHGYDHPEALLVVSNESLYKTYQNTSTDEDIPTPSVGDIIDQNASKDEESATPSVGDITILYPNDILLGRGRRSQFHSGNVRLRTVLEDHLESYDNGRRKEKLVVVQLVIDLIHAYGGRFLRPCGEGDTWILADEETIARKVKHDFRTLRSISKRQEQGGAPLSNGVSYKRTRDG